VIDLERVLVVRPPAPPADTEEYTWDANASGFEYKDEGELRDDEDDDLRDENIDLPAGDTDFFSVFKRIIYGHEVIDLPVRYLEDMDVLELSGYEISDLDGIRYCKDLVILDISNNSIIDISELAHLTRLKELYCSDNRIGFIDGLGYLQQLRIVDLSNNSIEDIAPLFDLDNLEYVNIVGNRIPQAQVAVLVHKGVMVIR
jgi:internalin A